VDGAVECARLVITADNTFEAWVNGQKAGKGQNFHQGYSLDVRSLLKPGANRVTVEAVNTLDTANPAGLVGALDIKYRDGRAQTIRTDAGWEAAKSAEGDWSPALVLGPMGMAPWGDVQESPEAVDAIPDIAIPSRVLAGMGVPPDFQASANIRYVHKRLSGADILEAARRIGAAQVIRGSYQRDGNRVIVTAMHLDRERPAGRVLARIPGTLDNLLDLQTEVAQQVLSALGYETDGRRDVTTSAKPGKKLRRLYAAAQTAYTAGQYAKAVEHCGAALNEDPERIELLSLMGVCYARLGDYEHAIACHKQLEQIALERNDPHRLVEATGNLGVMYYFRGEFPLAYDLMRRSGQLASDLNLLPLLAKTCSNLGFVLNKMERLAEADQAFGEAIQIKLSLGATASLMAPYNGRGEIALQQGRWSDALDCYRQALDWAVKLSDRVNIGLCHTNLGRCYVQMQDYDLAEQHLQEAVANLAATDFPNGIALAFEQLAELHLRCDRLEAALESIDRRIGLARRHANRHMEAAAWEQKARVYEKSGKKDEVIDCMRKSFELQQTKSPYEPLPSSPAFRPRRQPNP